MLRTIDFRANLKKKNLNTKFDFLSLRQSGIS